MSFKTNSIYNPNGISTEHTLILKKNVIFNAVNQSRISITLRRKYVMRVNYVTAVTFCAAPKMNGNRDWEQHDVVCKLQIKVSNF